MGYCRQVHLPMGEGLGYRQTTSLVWTRKFQTDWFKILFMGEAKTAVGLDFKSWRSLAKVTLFWTCCFLLTVYIRHNYIDVYPLHLSLIVVYHPTFDSFFFPWHYSWLISGDWQEWEKNGHVLSTKYVLCALLMTFKAFW